MNPASITVLPSETPFKELFAYEEGDGDIFAGRDRDIRLSVSRIISTRTCVIYGRSGLGKTSLLRAGILAHLRRLGFESIYIRTLKSLFGDLADAIQAKYALPNGNVPDEMTKPAPNG